MNKRNQIQPPANQPRRGPSWPSYRAIVEARAEERAAQANIPWLLWLTLVQPCLAFSRLKESGATPLLTAGGVVALAALVQAATLYSRNALLVATLNNLAHANLSGVGLPIPGWLITLASASPSTLLLAFTVIGVLLWLLLSLLTTAFTRMLAVANPPTFRNVAVFFAFAAMPLLAEAVLLPFLLLLEGGVLDTIDAIYKLLLVPWILLLVYLALRSLGLRRGQSSAVMLLVFFTVQFVITLLLASALWQLVTSFLASATQS